MGKSEIKKKIFELILVLTIPLPVSCKDNQIFIDRNKQMVKTCNGEIISRLHIENNDFSDAFFITIKDNAFGFNELNLKSINPDYNYTDFFDGGVKYALKPSSSYTITNSTFGDASACSVLIQTDSIGKITYSSVEKCH